MASERIRFDTFELDLKTGELHNRSHRVRLQDQPARLLILLASHPGEVVTRDEIHRTLWKDGEFVEFEHAVNTAVRKIRSALEDDPDRPRIIETLPRKGYRFIAAVEFIATVEAIEPVVSPVEVEALPKPAIDPTPDFILPVGVSGSRVLFLLAQLPYVAMYLAVFYHWYDLEESLRRTFAFIPIGVSLPALQVLTLLGFTIRVYLISLVGWGHTDAGPRFRRLFPWLLLPLDALWAATPLLVEHALGPLVSWTGLILMGWLIFGQRTLMRRIEQSR